MRDYIPGETKLGTLIVRGTSATNSVVQLLPRIIEEGLNVKIVAAISYGLFSLQSKSYQEQVLTAWDWDNSMIISNQAYRLMSNWVGHRQLKEYALTPDWDNRWRTGGSVEEIVMESHIDPDHVWEGIQKFVSRPLD